MSRLYRGIHFTNGDQAGRALWAKVRAQVFTEADQLSYRVECRQQVILTLLHAFFLCAPARLLAPSPAIFH